MKEMTEGVEEAKRHAALTAKDSATQTDTQPTQTATNTYLTCQPRPVLKGMGETVHGIEYKYNEGNTASSTT